MAGVIFICGKHSIWIPKCACLGQTPKTPIIQKGDGFMRKRKYAFTLRLNERELEHLYKLMEKSGLNKSTLIRKLIMGYEIRLRQPKEYFHISNQINEVRSIISNIAFFNNKENQITQENFDELHDLVKQMSEIMRELR